MIGTVRKYFNIILLLRRVLAAVRKEPRILGAALLLGGTYFLCMAAELIGLQYTSASTCSFLENSAVVMVPMLEAILLRRLPRPVVSICTVITFVGIGLIVLPGAGAESAASPAGAGIGELLCFIADLLYAAAIIITDRLSKKYEPMTLGILYVGIMGMMGLIASFLFETPQLPQTGGGGTWSFTLVGLILVIGAGLLLLLRLPGMHNRRKKPMAAAPSRQKDGAPPGRGGDSPL